MRARNILIGIGVVAVAAVGVAVVVIKSIDFNQYKGLAQEQAKAATGRDLVIAGKLDLRLSLTPAVVVENVSFANAAWGSRKEMVTLKRFEMEMALLPLLSGKVDVRRLILVEPDILLETDKAGKGNWVFDSASAPAKDSPAPSQASGKSAAPNISAETVRIEKAALSYKDGQTGQTTKVAIDRLDIKGKDMSSPLALDLLGSLDGKAFSLAGTLGAPADLLAGDKPFPVKLDAKAGGATVRLDGKINKPMEGTGLDLNLAVDIPSLPELGKLLGSELPKLPAITLSGQVTDPKGGYALSGLKVQVGKTQIGGDVRADLSGSRPKITAKLAGPLVDLAEMFPPAPSAASAPASAPAKAGAAPATPSGKKVFPDDPLPLDGLKAADADVDLKIEKIVLPNKMALDAVAAHALLNNGRLEIQPASLKAGGGEASAHLSLDGSSGKSAALAARVNGKGIDLGRMLTETGSSDLLNGGKTDLAIDLKGGGGSVRALMAGLNGDVLIEVGEGKINNNLLNMTADVLNQLMDAINPLAKKEPFTPFKCAVVKTPIKDGILTANKSIAVESLKINIVAAGTVNLKTEALDMGVKPTVNDGVGLGAAKLAGLVKLGGTLAEPSVGVDALEAAKTAASIGTAIATGGLSLLAGAVTDKATADSNPCQTALGKAAPAQQQKQAPASGAQQPQQQKQEGGVGGAIKGLFGR